LVELLTITVLSVFSFVVIGGIVLTKERLNSDGQQFYQYQQKKRKIKQ
jgi:hypothetical protein